MIEPDWDIQVKRARERINKGGWAFSSKTYLDVIDDFVAGIAHDKIIEKHGGNQNLVMSALACVTMAVQGNGSVNPIQECG